MRASSTGARRCRPRATRRRSPSSSRDVRYQGGEASYLDLLSAEQTLVDADQALAASDQALASDQVSVFKALGGGWQGAPKPAAKSDWNALSLIRLFPSPKTHGYPAFTVNFQ